LTIDVVECKQHLLALSAALATEVAVAVVRQSFRARSPKSGY
jgi:hypothetical protein